MSRKPRVQRTPEEKRLIVLEGLKSANIAETCRNHSQSLLPLERRGRSRSQGCAWGEKRSPGRTRSRSGCWGDHG